ncbi:uncharacterized protein LOC112349198 isoform X2 [Selaginella moellendorffii]|uniref:uncharacterized protein LOC112349198 isoform X2 n=1 Tax=Selaginella moellendorffii TaxID=88036 RepID=UPI000D1C70AD|nr:uncharacterized protein LOC112349198 isoform X2 [Selaginella moellendorffii]|eukprot:XP_024538929.1 uncharacterized protein LOC112349198 isoform X2 [Selaginella moellendorffii]
MSTKVSKLRAKLQRALATESGKHGKALLKLEYMQVLVNTTSPHERKNCSGNISATLFLLIYPVSCKLFSGVGRKTATPDALDKVLNDPNYNDDKILRVPFLCCNGGAFNTGKACISKQRAQISEKTETSSPPTETMLFVNWCWHEKRLY